MTYKHVNSGFATSWINSSAAAWKKTLATNSVNGYAVARVGAWGWRAEGKNVGACFIVSKLSR